MLPGFINGNICGLFAHAGNAENNQPAAGIQPLVMFNSLMYHLGELVGLFSRMD
jgi:hypothetical protein